MTDSSVSIRSRIKDFHERSQESRQFPAQTKDPSFWKLVNGKKIVEKKQAAALLIIRHFVSLSLLPKGTPKGRHSTIQ